MKPLGALTADLRWLSPCAHSLLVLARSPIAAGWPALRTDPGLAVLLARAAGNGPIHLLAPTADVRVLRTSLQYLRAMPDAGFVDWDEPACRTVYHAALRQAHLAVGLAACVAGCDPHRAWIAGLLAPLGWLAACAVDPVQVQHQLARVSRRRSPQALDAAAVARRLARSWHLPRWLATATGQLGLPVELAARLGADPPLFQVVQLAVLLRQREQPAPYLAVGAEPGELLAALRLSVEKIDEIVRVARAAPMPAGAWEPPARQPLLVDLLELGLRDRQRVKERDVERLHADIDRLQGALEARRAEDGRRLQSLKLSALAEFAAGAGHEINNPLAVISGQAQYLLRQLELVDGPAEEIDDPKEYLANLKSHLAPSLQKIIGQTHRIHGILTELMQFARPATPKAQTVDAAAAMRDVANGVQALADERRVRLVCTDPPPGAAVQADPAQVRAALTALLRNGVEAAPAGGWAGVRAELDGADRLALVVEDSGPGPGVLAREHLFDPFFSGRSAGRGRGLGLSMAWRLARQQAGDVRFDGSEDGVTRFSLVLPVAVTVPACVNGCNGD